MRLSATIAAAAAFIVIGAGVRASGVTIDQSGQVFSEKSVALNTGDAVTFANKDDVSHNITVVNEDDDTADLGLQKPGENLTYKFDKAGRFKVRCSIHPSMKMTVTVK
ncbi:MAG: plastocyanin/azurin family copper-binding protein [Rhodopila sp.]|jgi:plastocyanin